VSEDPVGGGSQSGVELLSASHNVGLGGAPSGVQGQRVRGLIVYERCQRKDEIDKRRSKCYTSRCFDWHPM